MPSALISSSQLLCLLLSMVLLSLAVSAYQINITAVIGENKILPCRAENGSIRLVEWKRTDIKEGIVLRYRGQVDKGNQHPSFKDRVVFQDIEVKNGNLSLDLINVRMNDAGTYEAEVVYEGTNIERKLTCTILLHVAPPELIPSWATALLVIAGVLLLILIGFLLYCFLPRSKSVQQVQMKEGEESVLLPCRTRAPLLGNLRVEWTDGGNKKVHVFKNGYDKPEEQDQIYKTRTKMNKVPLRTGDLSLTLRHPTDEDSWTYTCRVYSKKGKILIEKHVQLKAKDQQVEVEEEGESVPLQSKTSLPLHQDQTVERINEANGTVHVAGEQDQTHRNGTKMNEHSQRTEDTNDHKRGGAIMMERQDPLQVKAGTGQVQNKPEDIRTRTSSTDSTPLMAEESV